MLFVTCDLCVCFIAIVPPSTLAKLCLFNESHNFVTLTFYIYIYIWAIIDVTLNFFWDTYRCDLELPMSFYRCDLEFPMSFYRCEHELLWAFINVTLNFLWAFIDVTLNFLLVFSCLITFSHCLAICYTCHKLHLVHLLSMHNYLTNSLS